MEEQENIKNNKSSKSSKINKVKVAIAGNPNCGKTTLFNGLTGAHQHVGNYPGVTVEKKFGYLAVDEADFEFEFVDLPGTYGLTAYSEDEMVARKFLIDEKPDLILNVIDAANIERNLYLTAQLLELHIPIVIALNMVDTAKGRGVKIDVKKLSDIFQMSVVETIGTKKETYTNLITALIHNVNEAKKGKGRVGPALSYGLEIDDLQARIASKLAVAKCPLHNNYPWMSIKLIEGDSEIITEFQQWNHPVMIETLKEIETLNQHIEVTLCDFTENIVSGYRYGFVSSICSQCVDLSLRPLKTKSDYLDAVFLNRFLGPICLLGILWIFYQFVFLLGEPLVTLMESGIAFIHKLSENHIPSGLFQSLITSGIIDGVGGVLGFTPLIMLMFLVISVLEDSGYMARIAFLLDRILRTFGMHGNSILAFVVSGGIAGGCAVPGIMATRTLKDPKERLATILTVPFMNCGAKLPVYSVLIAAFFSDHRGSMMFVITLMSWTFALFVAGFLRKTILRGESTPFVMELPPYRFPTWKGIIIHMWERTWMYIKKAGTFILSASIIMWILMTFPVWHPPVGDRGVGLTENELAKERLYHSTAGIIGRNLAYVTEPLMGFDWQTNIALVAGLAAKEVVVSTMGIAYSLGAVEEESSYSLSARLSSSKNWNPLKAFSLIVFVMLYVPCISVIAVIRKETASWKWSTFTIFYTTGLAFLFATIVYHAGLFILY